MNFIVSNRRECIVMYKVYLPDLGEGIEMAQIACWHKKVNDRIEKDEDLVELVTDKASFNVESEQTGIIKEICVSAGQAVRIGTVLANIEVERGIGEVS